MRDRSILFKRNLHFLKDGVIEGQQLVFFEPYVSGSGPFGELYTCDFEVDVGEVGKKSESSRDTDPLGAFCQSLQLAADLLPSWAGKRGGKLVYLLGDEVVSEGKEAVLGLTPSGFPLDNLLASRAAPMELAMRGFLDDCAADEMKHPFVSEIEKFYDKWFRSNSS